MGGACAEVYLCAAIYCRFSWWVCSGVLLRGVGCAGIDSHFLSGNNTGPLVRVMRLLELYSCVLQLLDEDKAESLYVTDD